MAGRPIGLASERLGFGPATLQTVVHDHVAVRTPSRPDHWPGNALHLLAPPADLAPWWERFDRTLGHLPGVARRVVCWDTDGPDSGPATTVGGEVALMGTLVGVLEPDAPPPSRAIPDGVTIVRATTPAHWAGAKVLYLQTDWQGDEPYWRWHVDQQRLLVEDGGGVVLVAYQVGIPVGRAALFVTHAGVQPRVDHLAVVEDVITHPLYRGSGVASVLVAALVDLARRLDPDMRVVVRSEPDSTEAAWYARLGFAPVSRTWTAVVTPAGTPDARR
jgi:GNAT superfamily N-acetyltransferase